jgi:NhaP-type Na+/H+ or K+/H+ antiporter
MSDDDNSLLPESTDVILFMSFGLAMGIIVMQILSKLGDPVPYTVVIFLLGVLFSLNNQYSTPSDSIWSDSILKWSKIDAELMLYVFLPPLIFGEAMSLNWFFVVGGFMQSLLLAGPGVLIGAAAMAGFAKIIIPHDWSWYLCFVFGSILSATDPVAVVALLKEAGASQKLTILIVGESLLNDGTAMVLFTLFFNMLTGKIYTGGEIVAFFFEACLGSPLFGVACGLFIVRWLRSCNRSLKEIDTVVQICITICCAYLIFFVAQSPMEVSGVLACCGAGAMMSWLAPPLILNHESMHNVWSIIEWTCNTLIFLLAGLIIGSRTLNHVNLRDWGIMVLLYIILTFIRVVVIALLFPWLSTMGHKCSQKEAVFMAHAGLRGALSMALALIVEKHRDESDSRDQAPRLFFYVGGIAALTLIVNATTAQWLLLKLGLMGQQSIEQDMVVTQIRKRLQRKVGRLLDEMRHYRVLELGEKLVDDVRLSCYLMRHSDLSDWNETTRASEVDTIMDTALLRKRTNSFGSGSVRTTRSG